MSVSAGASQTCAISATHGLYCWGFNGYGQLGDGTFTARNTPKKVSTSTSWTNVSAALLSTSARHSSGAMYCWGSNSAGQLGDGTTTDRYTPAKVD